MKPLRDVPRPLSNELWIILLQGVDVSGVK